MFFKTKSINAVSKNIYKYIKTIFYSGLPCVGDLYDEEYKDKMKSASNNNIRLK